METKSLVPKKGLEPPHPCGYMDLNHARLPIPPLRQVTSFAGQPQAALKEETTPSILTRRELSVKPASPKLSAALVLTPIASKRFIFDT